MYQIYFLTVVADLFVGFLVADSFFRKRHEACAVVLDLFSSANAKLTVSLISLLVGIIALFKPGELIFIGDLLPALGAIIGGLVVGSQALGAKSEDPPAFVGFISNFTEKLVVPLGIAIMVIGLLHGIIPTAVLL